MMECFDVCFLRNGLTVLETWLLCTLLIVGTYMFVYLLYYPDHKRNDEEFCWCCGKYQTTKHNKCCEFCLKGPIVNTDI